MSVRAFRVAVAVLPVAILLAGLAVLVFAAIASAGGGQADPQPFRWS